MTQKLLIAFNGTRETGQFLGDQLCSIKAAYLFADNSDCDRILLAMSPANEMHFLWQKFIDTYNCEVIYDTFHAGNMDQRFENWSAWQRDRQINGLKFDIYKELYRRIDGGRRQPQLCGGIEAGLRRKNIFEYFWYGQESVAPDPVKGMDSFDDSLIYHQKQPADRQVLIAPHAKCQGNHVFTFDYWHRVVRILIDAGITVTVNYDGHFAEELNGHPLYRKVFPDFKGLQEEVCRHKIVACGNTGVGWLAAACGTPLMAMQPPNSNMADYRYELCGLKSLVEILDTPDADYCAKRLIEEVNRVVVFTTGCYDVIHAGHIRHLEESKAHGTKLIVGLNSDTSVNRLKGIDRPFNPQAQREVVLRALKCVDDVRVFDGDDALELIKSIKPDVITNGCDHDIGSIVGKQFVEGYGGKVVVTSGTRTQSSTKLIAKTIKTADVLKAVNDACGVSPNPFGKLKLLADQYLTVAHLEGNIADVGAYRGGCSLILRRLAPDKELHVFDTWAGTPFDDDLCHHKKGSWPASLAECKSLVGEGALTHYHEGVFPYTVDDLLKTCKFCFVFVDPDTYQTVRDAIEFFWPRMVTGGKMMFDDYDWAPCAGVKKAVDEAFAESDRVVFAANYACVVTKR